jgi:hypothetical protein
MSLSISIGRASDAGEQRIRFCLGQAATVIQQRLGYTVNEPIAVAIAPGATLSGVNQERVIVLADRHLSNADDTWFQQLITHELVHWVQHAVLGQPVYAAGVPCWFYEGMALHVAGQVALPGRLADLQTTRSDLQPFMDVKPDWPAAEIGWRYDAYELAVELLLKMSGKTLPDCVQALSQQKTLAAHGPNTWHRALRVAFGIGMEKLPGMDFWDEASRQLPHRFNPSVPSTTPSP